MLLVWLLIACNAEFAHAQLEFEGEPILYEKTQPTDRVAKLQRQLEAGEISLEYDADHGYLPAVLKQLGVPQSSQTLVFSQTSLQLRNISPARPRALYFNDDIYVGWVQEGDLLEVSAVDPNLGAIFYTLDQARETEPKFVRDRGQCLICHASARTQGVPGYLMRSLYPDAAGRGVTGSAMYVTEQSSPFEQRFGGWYVTGEHGAMRHMGNVLATVREGREYIDRERGANARELKKFVQVAPYLTPDSDLVALLVLAHQTQMHNLITLANFESRQALHYNQVMNKALDRPAEFQSESTQRRIDKVCDKLLKCLLFADEAPLTSPVRGTSRFAEEFATPGPKDKKGRSLRKLNLETRLLEYPCSYLIYSESFAALPPEVKQVLYPRLIEVLTAKTKEDDFAKLSLPQRQAIYEILHVTLPEFGKYAGK